MELNFDFATCVANSERIAWRIDDVLPPTAVLDRSRRFLPAALADNSALTFLTEEQRLQLNQITGKAYMNLFGFVEVYIEAMVLEHAQSVLFGDRTQMRALVRFADEEVKHQLLFTRFCSLFDQQFGRHCAVLDRAVDVANIILATTPLSVLFTTLHIEQMTQQHYVESVRDDSGLDPLCAEILRQHWLEESQHARIDLLLLRDTHLRTPVDARDKGFNEYLAVLTSFDDLLGQQAKLDVHSFEELSGRKLDALEAQRVQRSQHSAYRSTFLVCGMTNPTVVKTVQALWPNQEATLADAARAFGRQ